MKYNLPQKFYIIFTVCFEVELNNNTNVLPKRIDVNTFGARLNDKYKQTHKVVRRVDFF